MTVTIAQTLCAIAKVCVTYGIVQWKKALERAVRAIINYYLSILIKYTKGFAARLFS